MKIDNEIKVRLFAGSIDRLRKSSGSEEVREINGLLCHEGTFVPREPWMILNENDYEKIICNKNHNFNDISLIKLPKYLIKELEGLKIKNCINNHDINYIQNSPKWLETTENILNFLRKFNLDNQEIITHRLYFGQSNLMNNTFNTAEGVFIGMHLDSWEGDHINMRYGSRNRICINLGNESRFLLFYNISILSMAQMIEIQTNMQSLDINSIYKKFASKFQDVPIYRLEISPYEAYIAPTEFIIHDGSSLYSKFPDINLTFRGKFHYQKSNSIFNLDFIKRKLRFQ
jgi:hypothetical protein